MKKIKNPTPYKQGKFYYFKATVEGKRRTFPTYKESIEDAARYIKQFMEEVRADYIPTSKAPSLESYLLLYTDIETNPKYKQSKITGSHYGHDHAKHVALGAKRVLDLLPRELLKRKVANLTRQDCIQVRSLIHSTYGNSSSADNTFGVFKSIINYAAEEGLTKGASPALRLADIKYKKTSRIAIPIDDIAEILEHDELFYSDWEKTYFLCLATTGMRRSEAAALHSEQFKMSKGRPLLKIDRARKDSTWDEVGEPKWGIVRTIPVPGILWEHLEPIVAQGGEIFPTITRSKIDNLFKTLRCYAPQIQDMEAPELLEELTPHILRHSLNTALLIEGVNTIMIQEFLSWKHQDKVQEGYTHLYARNLIPVADAIDRLFGYKPSNVFDMKKAPSL